MSLTNNLFLSLLCSYLSSRRTLFLYATVWTGVLTVAVAIAALAPEAAFVRAISPSSPFSDPCENDRFIRIPIDDAPNEIVCLPARLFLRSRLDLLVPPVFAAVVVAGSACVVRALGL